MTVTINKIARGGAVFTAQNAQKFLEYLVKTSLLPHTRSVRARRAGARDSTLGSVTELAERGRDVTSLRSAILTLVTWALLGGPSSAPFSLIPNSNW